MAKILSGTLAAALAGFVSVGEARVGLLTTTAEVVADRLAAGRTYDLASLNGRPFEITNNSEETVVVAIGAEAPSADLLRPGYEPVPDAAWVKISPDRLEIAPGETKRAEVRLAIPKGGAWRGRHFQAGIWSRMENARLAAGLRSRVLFSVGADRPSIASEDPVKIRFDRANAAVPADGRAGSVELVNEGRAPVSLRIRSAAVPRNDYRAPGWDPAPSPEFLAVETSTAELRPGEKKTVKFSLRLPKGPVHAGRKYAFKLIAEDAEHRLERAALRVYVEK